MMKDRVSKMTLLKLISMMNWIHFSNTTVVFILEKVGKLMFDYFLQVRFLLKRLEIVYVTEFTL